MSNCRPIAKRLTETELCPTYLTIVPETNEISVDYYQRTHGDIPFEWSNGLVIALPVSPYLTVENIAQIKNMCYLLLPQLRMGTKIVQRSGECYRHYEKDGRAAMAELNVIVMDFDELTATQEPCYREDCEYCSVHCRG